MNYILGFGLSTLGFLKGYKKNDIKILEKNSYNGGHAYSHKFKDFYFDEGTHILHTKNKQFLNLFLKKNKFISKSSKVLNYYNGTWFKYPVQNNLLNLDYKLDYLTTYLTRPNYSNPKNFLEWCLSAYGKEITNKFYSVYTKKYWNKNLDVLDTSWLPGRVFNANDKQVIKNTFFENKESVITFNEFKYPKKYGFYGFFKDNFKKYENITTNNVIIKKINLRKKTISYGKNEEKFDKIYTTIPLPELKKYISFPKIIQDCLNSLEYTSLYTLNIIINKNTFKYDHDWNYLYDKNSNISRISILNNIGQVNSKNIALQVEMFKLGGTNYNLNIDYELSNLIKIFKINRNDIIDYDFKSIKYSYVISKNSNSASVKKIKEYLNKYDIYPFGLYGDWIYYWSDQAFLKGLDFGKKFNK